MAKQTFTVRHRFGEHQVMEEGNPKPIAICDEKSWADAITEALNTMDTAGKLWSSPPEREERAETQVSLGDWK